MVPGAVFAFVGLGSDLLDLDPRIVRAGELSREEYELILATTDVAVQLRDTSNGESSAAVADCLAAGVPTIVTDIGSNSELPDDVVVKVPRDISDGELALLIASLLGDHDRRSTLSACGRRTPLSTRTPLRRGSSSTCSPPRQSEHLSLLELPYVSIDHTLLSLLADLPEVYSRSTGTSICRVPRARQPADDSARVDVDTHCAKLDRPLRILDLGSAQGSRR